MGLSSTSVLLQGGKLVAVVRGANAPLLQKTILDQLEAERKVLAEGRERKVVRRPVTQQAQGVLQACRALPVPLTFLGPSAGSFRGGTGPRCHVHFGIFFLEPSFKELSLHPERFNLLYPSPFLPYFYSSQGFWITDNEVRNENKGMEWGSGRWSPASGPALSW